MINFIYGSDTKAKSEQVAMLAKSSMPLFIPTNQISENLLNSYASQVSLFGEKQTIILENPLTESDAVFDEVLLKVLKDSETQFIFTEDSFTATELKKYKKYFEKEFKFDLEVKKVIKSNPFDIANAYGARDRIKTWTLYMSTIEKGEAPEAIAGMLFWKIKTMLAGSFTKPFTRPELLQASSSLVDIYHKSHRGECDMEQALEQFILTTL